MELMDASVYVGDGVLEVRQVAVPEPGPATCCRGRRSAGSAAPTCTSCWSGSPGPGPCSATSGRGRSPRSATTSTAGRSVTGSCAGPTPGCGECRACVPVGRRCASTDRSTDHLDFRGAFARYVVAPAAQLLAVPEALSIRQAALVEPTAVAHARGDALGCDARRPGARDRRRSGRDARDRGAARAGHPRRDRVGAVADPPGARAGGGRGAGRRAARAAALADGAPVDEPYPSCSSARAAADAAESAIDQLDFAGTCVLVGTGHDLPRINHNRVIVLENTIIGAYNYDADGFAPALALLASGAMPLDALAEPVDVLARRAARGAATLRGGRVARQGDGPTRPFAGSSERVMSEPTFAPRLNHVAITMPPGRARRRRPRRDQGLLRRRVRLVRGRQQRRVGQPAHPHDRADAVRVPAARRSRARVPAPRPLRARGVVGRRRSRRSSPRPRRGRRRTTACRSST